MYIVGDGSSASLEPFRVEIGCEMAKISKEKERRIMSTKFLILFEATHPILTRNGLNDSEEQFQPIYKK